jgi:hypothetical protein
LVKLISNKRKRKRKLYIPPFASVYANCFVINIICPLLIIILISLIIANGIIGFRFCTTRGELGFGCLLELEVSFPPCPFAFEIHKF